MKVLTQRLASLYVLHRSVWIRGDGHSSAIENQYPPDSSYTVEQLAVSFIKEAVTARHPWSDPR